MDGTGEWSKNSKNDGRCQKVYGKPIFPSHDKMIFGYTLSVYRPKKVSLNRTEIGAMISVHWSDENDAVYWEFDLRKKEHEKWKKWIWFWFSCSLSFDNSLLIIRRTWHPNGLLANNNIFLYCILKFRLLLLRQ